MERFAIAHSRSGKSITSHPDLDRLESFEDIFDAAAVLALLAVPEARRNADGELATHLATVSSQLLRLLRNTRQWDVQRAAVGANTAFDVRSHAAGLLRPEFKE